MIHCPNCDVPLRTADLRAGSCPACHTVITPDMETIPASPANRFAQPSLSSAPYPINAWSGAVTDDHATLPVANEPVSNEPTTPASSRNQNRYGLIAIGAAVALAVVLLATLLLRQTHTPLARGTTGQRIVVTVTTVATETSTPATSKSATPGPTPAAPTVGTPATTASPAMGTPVATVTPTPPATATPAGQPILRVSPLTFSLLACVNAQETFTIANQGNATLQWAVSTSYTLNQMPGPLAAGATVAVTVSGIYKSGTVIITATYLAGKLLSTSPQTVTITCTV